MANDNSGALQEKPFSAYLPIAITAVMFAFVLGALVTSCMSIFFPLLAQDNGVPVSQITVYMTIGSLLMAFCGPLFGRLFAKLDIRVIGSGLAIVIALCFVSLSFNASIVQIWISGAIMMMTAMLTLGLFLPTLINRWFKDKAGALLGFSAAFTGVGGVVWIQVGQAIITASGYRTAFLVYALIAVVLTLPFALFAIRSNPSERGMLPYVSSKRVAAEGNAKAAAESKNWTVNPSLAVKSSAFWVLCIAVALSNATVMIAQFFPTYVNSLNNAGTAAFVTGAGLATFTMAGQAVCKFILGAGNDFSPAKTILASCGIGIIAVLCIWLGATTFALPLGGFIFGMFYATPIVLNPLVAGNIFGVGKDFSVVWGRTMLPSGLIAAPAGILWPWIAETFGGFSAVFIAGICCIAIFAALCFLAMRLGKNLPHETAKIGGPADAPAKEEVAEA